MAVPDPVALDAARRTAEYEIGDPSWADLIVGVYLKALTPEQGRCREVECPACRGHGCESCGGLGVTVTKELI